jgi:hypothetical protein
VRAARFVLPDLAIGEIQYSDCAFVEHAAAGLRAMINADSSPRARALISHRRRRTPPARNGATSVSRNVTLGWASVDPDGDPLTFDLYFGDTPEPPLVVND